MFSRKGAKAAKGRRGLNRLRREQFYAFGDICFTPACFAFSARDKTILNPVSIFLFFMTGHQE
jgi:hypothetical protein